MDVIPGRTTLLKTDAAAGEIAPRLQKAIKFGVFVGDLGSSSFRLHAGPKLAIAGELAAAQEEAAPLLRFSRPSTATGATVMGRWAEDGEGSVIRMTYVPPLYDFVLLVILVVILGPMVIQAWARPEVEALVRWGVLAVLIGACATVLAVSWARMVRLQRALLAAVAG